MRKLIELLTSILTWLRWKFNFRINKKDNKKLMLNLGCGLAVHPGWVNIDGSLNAVIASLPKSLQTKAFYMSGSSKYYKLDEYLDILNKNYFFQADLSHGIPAKDNTVTFVYSSHFFEHLFRDEAERLMLECYRVMEPGAVIRTVVPDLDYAIKIMNEGEKRKALKNYFFVEESDAAFGKHKYMYDFPLMEELLKKSGFTNIKRCNYQQGEVPNIVELDNRPHESLYVEAQKP